jgi:hypothetical protein
MAIVYKATNKNNGKVYFGQTGRNLEQRRAAHASSAKQGSTLRFHQAIRKYGIDAFLFEEVYSGDINSVRKMEERYIEEYKSIDFNVGYNSTKGGCGGWIVPKEKYNSWLLKITDSVQGAKNRRWSGYTDDELVYIACNKLNEKNYTYVPSFNVIKSLIPDFPNIFKGNYRFSGLGWKECQKKISDRLGLKIINHYRSQEMKDSLRKKNSNKIWYTNGNKDIQITDGLLVPEGFVRGRTFSRGKHVKN